MGGMNFAAFKKRILAILEHPSALLGGLIVWIHWLLFSWWLDERMMRRGNRKLATQVREHLSFLYSDYEAQVVPNDGEPPPYFDWAKVTVTAGDLVFSFTRDRGLINVRVAPKHAPLDWQDLSVLLALMDIEDGRRHDTEFARLPTVAQLLEPQMARLKDALSEAQFASTKAALSHIYEVRRNQAVRRLENDLNERRKRLGLM